MLISMATPHQVPAMDSSCGGVENLESLVHWFESCNDAQQAAIGTALLGRANPKAAHLLHTFLQMRLQAASPIWRLEIQRANDPCKISILPLVEQVHRLSLATISSVAGLLI
jgi:hypothetical protein